MVSERKRLSLVCLQLLSPQKWLKILGAAMATFLEDACEMLDENLGFDPATHSSPKEEYI